MAGSVVCADCATPLGAGDAICSSCGVRVLPLGPGGASLQVAAPHLEELRNVTVLFADLVGNTALAEQLDPEEMRRVLERLFALMGGEVLRFGGTVDKFVGDEVMAVFGAPTAHEDDPMRAIRCALAMQRSVAGYSADIQQRYGTRISLRIGINSGEVVAGMLASAVQTAYTVVGDAVNTAKRIQAAAAPDEIVIGRATRDHVARAVQLDPRLPVTAKGKGAPVEVFAVVGLIDRTAATDALVGRATERAHLVDALDRLSKGEGGVVSLIGDGGIGKSRLLAEARVLARERGMLWLNGQATSQGRPLAYLPFREMLRAYARIGEPDTDGEKWEKLRRLVGPLLKEDSREALPYLATLGGIRPPGEMSDAIRSLDPEAVRRQILRGAYLLVQRLAGNGPIVLALEDWHWADRASQGLLEHLLPLTDRFLLIWTGRPEPGSPLPAIAEASRSRAHRYLDVRLLPLTDEETGTLVAGLLGSAVPVSVRDHVCRRAEGNPFFADQIVRALTDSGALARRPTGEWAFDPSAAPAMPPGIQAAIAARLDLLAPLARELARTASVLGRRFSRALLVAVQGGSIDLEVPELIAHGILTERATAHGPEFAFTHALVQETAYKGTLRTRRREVHERAAAAIRTDAADRPDEVAGLLAYHYAAAELWEQAQAYLFTVGDEALRLAADTEAIDLYERALDAYARAFGPRWDPRERAIVERKLGEARYRLGEFGPASTHLDQALDLLGSARPRSRSRVRIGIARELAVQLAHRTAPATARPARPGLAADETYQVLWTLQLVDYASDLERLFYDILRGLNLAERLPPSHRTLRAYFGMTLISHNVGLARLASVYAGMARRLADALADPLADAIASACVGLDHYARGRYPEAAASLRASALGYRGAGDLAPWAGVLAYLNVVLAAQGALAEAWPIGSELEQVGRSASDRRISAIGPHCRAHVLSWAGRIDESRAEFHQALETYEAIPDHHLVLSATGELAVALLRAGEITEARSLVDRGTQLAREHRLRGWWLTPILSAEAGALLEEARTTEGSERAAILGRAARACGRLKGQGRLHAEAIAPAERHVGTLEWLRARSRRATAAWQRSFEAADRSGLVTERLETHLAIARATGSTEDQTAAAVIADRLRATLVSATVRG